MGQIQSLGTAVDDLSASNLYHLSHLGRGLRLVVLTFWYGLDFLQLFFQTLYKSFNRIEDVESFAKIKLI